MGNRYYLFIAINLSYEEDLSIARYDISSLWGHSSPLMSGLGADGAPYPRWRLKEFVGPNPIYLLFIFIVGRSSLTLPIPAAAPRTHQLHP
ncbi:hypothetical protein QUA40_13785 [Microcoleus sp. Pol11C3]|uniref:hypothetical protein n=1 Tax=Microcoleus sp. Pol11C3 TaxID=3055390 RepID=UPI002FD69D9F